MAVDLEQPALADRFDTAEAALAYRSKKVKFQPSITVLNNAIVSPIDTVMAGGHNGQTEHYGGVFDANGTPCVNGINIPLGGYHFPKITESQRPIRDIPGKWIFGGYTKTHFGQFLTECVNRLWAADEPVAQGALGVIYIYFRQNINLPVEVRYRHAEAFPKVRYRRDIIAITTGGLDLLVSGDTLRVEELIVPNALSTNAVLDGHPLLRRLFQRPASRADQLISSRPNAEESGRRLYISRSKLAFEMAHFMLEEKLERNLTLNGYEIFHPQEHSIEEQITAFRRADYILLAEGSAGHLLAMVARPDQKIGVISRRPDYHRFTKQLRGFGVEDCHTISSLEARVVPLDDAAQSRLAAVTGAPAVLSFERLRDQLSCHGFIDAEKWSIPSSAELDAAVVNYQRVRNATELRLNKPLIQYGVKPVDA